MNIDGIFKTIGYWGKFQKRLSILLACSIIPNGLLVMVFVFTNATPPHRCYVPEIDNTTSNWNVNTNLTDDSLSNFIPLEEKDNELGYSKCKMFKIPLSSLANHSNDQRENTVDCQYGWVYDVENKVLSAVVEFDLVCGRGWLNPLSMSCYTIGIVISSLVTGDLSDRYGRRVIFLLATYLQFIFIFICGFSVNVVMYCLMLLLSGGFGLTNLSTAVVIGTEFLDSGKRAILGGMEMIGFAIGYMMLSLVAYMLPNWRWILFFMASMIIFYLPYCWLILESPRWLIQTNKNEKAKKVIKIMAKTNGAWSTDLLKEMDKNESLEEETRSQYTILDLFRIPMIRKRLAISCYTWVTCNLIYYFFAYNVGNLGGNPYINCLIAAALEIPAGLLSLLSMKYLGRTFSYGIYMLFGSLSSILTPILLDVNTTLGISVAMAGKFASTAAYDVVMIYTPEIYPTLIRYRAFGICSFLGRLGSVIAPYFIFWGESFNKYLPYAIIFVVALVSVFLNLLLPETRNAGTPDTLEDAAKIQPVIA